MPTFEQTGIINAEQVQPELAGKAFMTMTRKVGGFEYNSALRDATVQTVLRAMYDEVKHRDDKKRDENFLS